MLKFVKTRPSSAPSSLLQPPAAEPPAPAALPPAPRCPDTNALAALVLRFGPPVALPLQGLPDRSERLADPARYAHPAPRLERARVRIRQTASNAVRCLRRGPARTAPAEPVVSGPYPWRPPETACWHFIELIDGISTAEPERLRELSRLLGGKLRRAGVRWPEPRNSAEQTLAVFRNPKRHDGIAPEDSGLNITEALYAVNEAATLGIGSRYSLMVSTEALIRRLAESHPGVDALLKAPGQELRPIAEAEQVAAAAAEAPRLYDFRVRLRHLYSLPETRRGSVGQLASCFLECLQYGTGKLEPSEEAGVIGQLLPVVESLIAKGTIAAPQADAAREACGRLEAYLQLSAALDVRDRDAVRPHPVGMFAMTHRRARNFLFGGLLEAALNPDELSRILAQQDIYAVVHPVLARRDTGHATRSEVFLQLKTLLRAMLDARLITSDQRNQVIAQVRKAYGLRNRAGAPVPAVPAVPAMATVFTVTRTEL